MLQQDNKLKENKVKNLGFTMIELVVAMGVFLSLFLIVIVNFRSGEAVNELRLETQKIASDIRKVQTLAMTGSTYGSQSIGVGGYGLVFTDMSGTISYKIFKDDNADGDYDDGSDTLLETKTLASDFNQLSFDPAGTTVNIVFQPYSSNVIIIVDAVQTTDPVAVQIIHSKVTGKTGIITITPISGKIDFKLQD